MYSFFKAFVKNRVQFLWNNSNFPYFYVLFLNRQMKFVMSATTSPICHFDNGKTHVESHTFYYSNFSLFYNNSKIIMCKQSFVTVCIRSKKHKLHIDDMLTVHKAIRKKRPVLPSFEEPTEPEELLSEKSSEETFSLWRS